MKFTLQKDQFSSLLKIFSIIQDECNDCDIRNGIIRQFNNSINSIFQVNLSSILNDSTIPISLLKQKIEMFKNFTGEDEITINVSNEGDAYFSIIGKFSSLRIVFPKLEYLDNKFISEEDFSNKISNLSEENLILSAEINKSVCNMIKGISKVFSSESVRLVFNGDKSGIVSQSAGGDNFVKFISNLEVIKEVPKSFINIYSSLFTIDHDDGVSLKVYSNDLNLFVIKSSSKVGDINIDIFARDRLTRA